MKIEKNILFYSLNKHPTLSIIGKVHFSYFFFGKVIKPSEINLILPFYNSRSQLQQELIKSQTADFKEVTNSDNVSIIINVVRPFVSAQVINDTNSNTIIKNYSGKYTNYKNQRKFTSLVNRKNKL